MSLQAKVKPVRASNSPDSSSVHMLDDATNNSLNKSGERIVKRVPIIIENGQLNYVPTRSSPKPPCVFCCFRCCRPEPVGRFWMFSESKTKDGKPYPRCIIGPDWVCLVFITVPVLLILPSILLFVVTLPNLPWGLYIPAIPLVILTGVSLMCTACRSPGIFPRYSAPQAENWRQHPLTDSFRPPMSERRILFCSETQTLYFLCIIQ